MVSFETNLILAGNYSNFTFKVSDHPLANYPQKKLSLPLKQ
ncbi:hypothetical protein HMPREF2141_00060 [Bacteroides uniformis]|nr:hypothetical protein HMPREF2141_00060 [Bacteroides uniformis]